MRGSLALGGQPAQGLHFAEGFPDADEAGAAAGGVEQHVGQLPVELFGDFVAHRFLAFEAVRLLEGRDVEQGPVGVAAGAPGPRSR